MISTKTAGVVAGIAGTLFIGYCIYFDKKRRSDPLFRQKLKERRRKAKSNSSQSTGGASVGGRAIELPNLQDAEAVQKFFLRQVQMGEELLAQGDIENGVEHLSYAVAVCGQPQQLLQVLYQTLPSGVFQLLVQKLPETNKKVNGMVGGKSGQATIQEVDDLE